MGIGFPLPKSLRRSASRSEKARIVARPSLWDSLPPAHQLFKLADPKRLDAFWSMSTPSSERYEWKRRACVLRAWCALRLGWRDHARENLRLAAAFRRDAQLARARGR